MPAKKTGTGTPTDPQHFEYVIDKHRTRGEVRINAGEWSAYVFVDPVTASGQPSAESARGVLPTLLRALADDLEKAK